MLLTITKSYKKVSFKKNVLKTEMQASLTTFSSVVVFFSVAKKTRNVRTRKQILFKEWKNTVKDKFLPVFEQFLSDSIRNCGVC